MASGVGIRKGDCCLLDSWGRSAGYFHAVFRLWDNCMLCCPRKGTFFMGRDAFSQYHPLTNFMYFLGVIGFTVVVQHPLYLAASCISGGVYLILLDEKKGRGAVIGMLPLFAVLTLINPLFNTHGAHVLFFLFGRPYTLEALYYGMAVAGIFVAMLLWFLCYGIVLTSDKFVCLFGSLMPSLSLLLVMVLRMIPNFIRKAGQIHGARKAIGKGVDTSDKLAKRTVDGMKLLSALTDWALEGSIVTADSMRSRGYGTAKRTSFQIYRFLPGDGVLLLLMAVLAGTALLAGGMEAVYIPTVSFAPPGWGFAAYCGYLLIPVILHGKEAVQWHISISRI